MDIYLIINELDKLFIMNCFQLSYLKVFRNTISYIFLLCYLPFQSICSQVKDFSGFEKYLTIDQQVTIKDYWPSLDFDSMVLQNDTLYSLTVKNGCISVIPLSSEDILGNIKHIPLNITGFPSYIQLYNNKWYVSISSEICRYDFDGTNPKKIVEFTSYIDYFGIVDGKIVVELYYAMGIHLYSLDGAFIARNNVVVTDLELMNGFGYKTNLINGAREISIAGDSVHIGRKYEHYKIYPEHEVFVGGYKNLGYFSTFEHRDSFVIRNMEDPDEAPECFKIPVRFADKYHLAEWPEGYSSINLKVLSEDNNTFYFITNNSAGRITVYKGVR